MRHVIKTNLILNVGTGCYKMHLSLGFLDYIKCMFEERESWKSSHTQVVRSEIIELDAHSIEDNVKFD